jgi:hypothetical protein
VLNSKSAPPILFPTGCSLFCVHLSNQKFGDGVGDARTTKLPRRENAAVAARITDKSVSGQCAPSVRQRKGPEMPGQPSLPPRAKSKLANILRRGGGSGIRTHVTVSRKHAFQACAFSHSATPPDRPRKRPGISKSKRAPHAFCFQPLVHFFSPANRVLATLAGRCAQAVSALRWKAAASAPQAAGTIASVRRQTTRFKPSQIVRSDKHIYVLFSDIDRNRTGCAK